MTDGATTKDCGPKSIQREALCSLAGAEGVFSSALSILSLNGHTWLSGSVLHFIQYPYEGKES
ncbi:MAG: hypothetical protein IT266_05440 [Saprospiraceae bacterium]|nr:hypothetical protein [Saprospiraceae bacterium]